MFVVRLQSLELGPNYRAFEARGSAVARFLGGRLKVLDGHMLEAAIYDVRTKDTRTAIEMVRGGKGVLVEIYPEPMAAPAEKREIRDDQERLRIEPPDETKVLA